MKFNTVLAPALMMGGALLFPVQNASAQLPLRAKIGGYMPQSDENGNLSFVGEVDAQIPNFGQGRYLLSAGYISGGGLRLIPVTLGRYFSPPNLLSRATGNVYIGAGLGPYFVRVRNDGDSESKTTLGGYATVGYQFPNPYFLEAKYHLVGKVNGVKPGGLALTVGRRF